MQFWVPDVRSEQFAREARRQAALVAETDRYSDDQDFIEAVSVTWATDDTRRDGTMADEDNASTP